MRPPSERKINDRLKQCEPVLNEYTDKEIDDVALSVFASVLVLLCVPKSKCLTPLQASALSRSIEHLKGGTHSKEILKANFARVIANWHFIAEEMPIPMWDGSQTPASIVVIGLKRMKCNEGELPSYMLKIRLKTGLAAGIILCPLLSTNAIANFIDRVSGARGCAVEEISGMRATVMVAQEGNKVKLSSWSCTAEQKKHNKHLADLRADISKCKLTQPCNVCNKSIKECPLAIWLPKENQ